MLLHQVHGSQQVQQQYVQQQQYAQQYIVAAPPEHSNPLYIQLADIVNARVKILYGSNTHRITARILDSHPNTASLQSLISGSQLESVASQIAAQTVSVGPVQFPPTTNAAPVGQIQTAGPEMARSYAKNDTHAMLMEKPQAS
jgi:hypothetical protein